MLRYVILGRPETSETKRKIKEGLNPVRHKVFKCGNRCDLRSDSICEFSRRDSDKDVRREGVFEE